MKMNTLVCAVGRHENNYIREWVEHYKKLGFSNICLYDNNRKGEERFKDVVADYVKSGFVILKDWSKHTDAFSQIDSYQDCYDTYGDKYDWIAFFDIDEFMEMETEMGSTVEEFLCRFPDDITNVRLCWKPFGDDGNIGVIDENYSVARFTKPLEANGTIEAIATKGIIRGGLKDFRIYRGRSGEHLIKCNTVAMDADFTKWLDDSVITTPKMQPIHSNAWLNHYRCKTIEECLTNKFNRGCICPAGATDENNFFKLSSISSYFRLDREKLEYCKEFFSYMKHPDITCCILCYQQDLNALRLYNLCKDFYTTYLIDTYTLDNVNCDTWACYNDPNILTCHNLHFGGGRIKAYEQMVNNDAKWLITMVGDVEFTDWMFLCMVDSIHNNVYGKEDATALVYGSCDHNSSCMGMTDIHIRNVHEKLQKPGQLRGVFQGELFVEIASREICDLVFPKLDYEDNKYGWGIDVLMAGLAKQMGKGVYVDDAFTVHHPEGTKYSQVLAELEYLNFRRRYLPDFGLKPRVAICTIIKNENKYLREWVEYYKNLGVYFIYLYDNNDKDGERPQDVIQDYIDSGLVAIRDVRGMEGMQLAVYPEFYGWFGRDFDWIGFIDADEFVTFKKFDNISDFFAQKKFTLFTGVQINWKNYGDNNLLEIPQNGILENLTKALPVNTRSLYDNREDNTHVKTFLRGGLAISNPKWVTPHTISNDGLYFCNAKGEIVNSKSPWQDYDESEAYIRHFQFKTISDLCEKIERGYPDGVMPEINERTKTLIDRFFKQNKKTKKKVEYLIEWQKRYNASRTISAQEYETQKED